MSIGEHARISFVFDPADYREVLLEVVELVIERSENNLLKLLVMAAATERGRAEVLSPAHPRQILYQLVESLQTEELWYLFHKLDSTTKFVLGG